MVPSCHREEPASRIQMQLERGLITDKKSKREFSHSHHSRDRRCLVRAKTSELKPL